uniref:Radical SAM protein n=1 Tax=Dictyoglomus thermophilum TaxID=14 RepID=A0A7C3MIZ5_DICTH
MDSLRFIEFSTENCEYIYDDVLGIIFPKDKYEHLVKELNNYLGNCLDNGDSKYKYFEEYYGKNDIFIIEEIKDFLKRDGFRQLILNVTDDCNMKCRYCYYHSGFYDYAPVVEHRSMNIGIAIRAVDFF